MKKATQKLPENVPGPFFVTEECISCSVCWELAPQFIKSHPIHTYAFFYSQPQEKTDLDLCFEALKICPVDCIHYNERENDDVK